MDTEILLKNLPLREKLCTEANTSLLNRFEQLVTLPETAWCLTPALASFYQVREDAIRQIIRRHRDELENDGYKVLSSQTLKEMPQLDFEIPRRGLAIFTRKAVLRIGMLLRNSPVAQMLRSYLIQVEKEQNVPSAEMVGLKRIVTQLMDHTEQIGRQAEDLTRHSHQINQHASQLISHSKLVEMIVNEMYKVQEDIEKLKSELKKQQKKIEVLEQNSEVGETKKTVEEYVTRTQRDFLKKEIEAKKTNQKILKEFKNYFKIRKCEDLPKKKFVEALEWLEKIPFKSDGLSLFEKIED